MCVNVEVTLPVLTKFLYYTSLRNGCCVALLITSLRNFFFLVFYVAIFMEISVNIHNPIAALLLNYDEPPPPEEDSIQKYFIFFTYEPIIIAEAFLSIFLIHLMYGILYETAHHFEYYLLCRFIVWVTEIIVLFVLCLSHNILAAWYLFFMIINILEVYLFMTVYSYYVNVLIESEQKRCEHFKNLPCFP